jgi:hypothetical protein
MDGQQRADAANEAAGAAKAKLKDTIDQGVASAASTAARAKEAAAQAGSAVAEAAGRASEQAQGALAEVSRRGSALGQYLSDTTVAYPLTALLVAAAIGYGLARVTRWP